MGHFEIRISLRIFIRSGWNFVWIQDLGCLIQNSRQIGKKVFELWLSHILFRWRYCHKSTIVFLQLTSSNLSKAAWGSFNKDRTRLFIKSHEAGVLFLPKFTNGSKVLGYYRLGSDISLPFDFPLTPYDKRNDKPFYHDIWAQRLWYGNKTGFFNTRKKTERPKITQFWRKN